jgi:hypothetical protein
MLRVSTLLCLTAFLISSIAFGDTVPIGYVSWDVTSPGASGEFDIFNGTGPNSSGDTTFPVSTPVNLSSLSLTIDFSNGSSVTEPSSYFTLAPERFADRDRGRQPAADHSHPDGHVQPHHDHVLHR